VTAIKSVEIAGAELAVRQHTAPGPFRTLLRDILADAHMGVMSSEQARRELADIMSVAEHRGDHERLALCTVVIDAMDKHSKLPKEAVGCGA